MRCAVCHSENVHPFKDNELTGFCEECGNVVTLIPEAPQGPQKMQIFFSYGHDNHADFVSLLKQRIEEKTGGRITVWIDHDRLRRGMHWRSEIAAGIRSSYGVMAFLSSYSARERGVCLDELAIAIASKHGMIKTVLLEPAGSFTPPARAAEYQWADMSDYPDFQALGGAEWDAYVERQADLIIQMLDSDEIRRYNYDLQFLRRKLLPGIPNELSKFDRLVEKELVGRDWLTERVERWLNNPDARRILLLYGKPGSGKSMFAAHLQHYNHWVAASLACDFQSDEFSRTDSIINWLAYKLAMRIPEYRGTLLYYFSDGDFRPGSGQDRFTRLILEPLGRCSIDGQHAPMVILIDGLDEARTGELMRFVTDYADQFTPWLRFLITARRESAIAACFEGYPAIDYDLCADDNRADLMQFFRAKLDGALAGRPDRERFYERLTEASEGVFAYAEGVCENILEDLQKDPAMDPAIYPLPRGLHALFRSTLDRRAFRWFTPDGTGLNFQGFWQRPLGMVLASPEPLPAETLNGLLHWGENEYRGFRRPLGAMLTEENGCLTVFHRSFAEWLQSSGAEEYHVSAADGLRDLARACYGLYAAKPEQLDPYVLTNLTGLLRQAQMTDEYAAVRADAAFMGKLRDLEEQLRGASLFDKSLPIAEELVRVFDGALDVYGMEQLSMALDRLGRNHLALSLLAEAAHDFSQALNLARKLVQEHPQDPAYRRNLSISLEQIADVLETNNNLSGALELYQESLEIDRKLAHDHPQDPRYQQDLSTTLIHVADVLKANNDLSGALKFYQESLDIRRKLAQDHPQDPQYRRDLSVSLDRVADVLKANNDLSGALELYQESLEIDRKLALEHPQDPLYRRDLSVSLINVADVLKANNDLPGALELYQESLEIARKLVLEHPQDPQYRRDLSVSLSMIADILKSSGDLPGALKLYQESLDIRRKLVLDHPQNPLYRRDLSVSLSKVADVLKANNDLPGAMPLYQESLEIDRKLALEHPQNPEYRRDLSVSLERAADVLKANNDLPGALRLYQESLEIDRKLVLDHPQNPLYRRDLAVSLDRVADVLKANNDLPGALRLYQESLDIRRRLAQEHPQDPQSIENLAVSHYNLGVLTKEQSYFDDAFRVARTQPQMPRCKAILSNILRRFPNKKQLLSKNRAIVKQTDL